MGYWLEDKENIGLKGYRIDDEWIVQELAWYLGGFKDDTVWWMMNEWVSKESSLLFHESSVLTKYI